jgi:hypothetical protein
VECFINHFCDHKGRKKERVKDPTIIKYCAANKFILVTPDKNMLLTHAETIKKTDVAIIASTRGTQDLDIWVEQVIKSKATIERNVKKYQRPWFMRLGLTGSINIQTVGASRSTKRHRPREGQETT